MIAVKRYNRGLFGLIRGALVINSASFAVLGNKLAVDLMSDNSNGFLNALRNEDGSEVIHVCASGASNDQRVQLFKKAITIVIV